MRDVETVARAICRAEKMNEDDPAGGWPHWQIAAIEVLHAIGDRVVIGTNQDDDWAVAEINRLKTSFTVPHEGLAFWRH